MTPFNYDRTISDMTASDLEKDLIGKLNDQDPIYKERDDGAMYFVNIEVPDTEDWRRVLNPTTDTEEEA